MQALSIQRRCICIQITLQRNFARCRGSPAPYLVPLVGKDGDDRLHHSDVACGRLLVRVTAFESVKIRRCSRNERTW